MQEESPLRFFPYYSQLGGRHMCERKPQSHEVEPLHSCLWQRACQAHCIYVPPCEITTSKEVFEGHRAASVGGACDP